MSEREPIAPEQFKKENKRKVKEIGAVAAALGLALSGHPSAAESSELKETPNISNNPSYIEKIPERPSSVSFQEYREHLASQEKKFPDQVKVKERFENESDFSVKIDGQWYRYTVSDTARPEDNKLAHKYIMVRAFPAADKLGLPRDIKFFLWDIEKNKVLDIVRQPNKWEYQPQKQKFEWEVKNNKLESVKTTLDPGYDVSEPKTIELKPNKNYETKEYEYKDKINT
jgi:hypothetical protein